MSFVAPHVCLSTPPVSTSANVSPFVDRISVDVPAVTVPVIVDSSVNDSSIVDSTNMDLPSFVTADWSASEALEWFDAFANSLS